MEDFAAFILTHGRPDRLHTLDSLRKHGYTGRVVILIDNEDKTAAEYHKRYGSMVHVFDKAEIASRIDEGDNFNDRRAILYARNAAFEVAARLGITYFVQLDDDYTRWNHKRDERGEYIERPIRDLDAVFKAMLDYFKQTPALSIAMAQGGDYLGGAEGNAARDMKTPKRKAMNSFFCSTRRPFRFVGRINEDVNTYTSAAARGGLFLTIGDVELKQKQTQTNAGGMTDLYADSGTYIKSFYTVMFQPSSVYVGVMQSTHARIHHKVRWRHTVPAILAEQHRKASHVGK